MRAPLIDEATVILLATRHLGSRGDGLEFTLLGERTAKLRAGPLTWTFEVVPLVEVLLAPGSAELYEASPAIIGGPMRRIGLARTPDGNTYDLRTVDGLADFGPALEPAPDPLTVALLVCRFLAPHRLDFWPVELEPGPDSPQLDAGVVEFRTRFTAADPEGEIVEGRDHWSVDTSQGPWRVTVEQLERRPVGSG